MAEMLSQAEIDALLGGGGSQESDSAAEEINSNDDAITSEQRDILGEIGNISMGTAATTLSALLNQRVNITTPVVTIRTWEEISSAYARPCVGVQIDYTIGLRGTNLLILVNRDVKIITNLMMGGDGTNIDDDTELSEIDLSAIGEAMNQMIGSSSTSLASMMNEKIDIATPKAFQMDFTEQDAFSGFINSDMDTRVVAISFDMQVGDLIDSKIVQALPIEFAIQMAEKLKTEFVNSNEAAPPQPAPAPAAPVPTPPPAPAPTPQPVYQEAPQPVMQQPEIPYGGAGVEMYQQAMVQAPPPKLAPNVNAQPVQFQNFDFEAAVQQKENINILMDVPLEVTVELGKTSKRIKEILEFSPGTIIELDKLAGEPIDILVNGKYVAKGEVVVIEENFAIRVTSIISEELRV